MKSFTSNGLTKRLDKNISEAGSLIRRGRLYRQVVNSLIAKHRNQSAAGVVTIDKRQSIKQILKFHLPGFGKCAWNSVQKPKRIAIVKDGAGLSVAIYAIDEGELPTFITMGREYK